MLTDFAEQGFEIQFTHGTIYTHGSIMSNSLLKSLFKVQFIFKVKFRKSKLHSSQWQTFPGCKIIRASDTDSTRSFSWTRQSNVPKSFYEKADVKEICFWGICWGARFLMLLENKPLSTNKRSTNINELSPTQLRE